MSEEKHIPQAKVKPLTSISKIWLIPIVALFIGAWMIFFHLYSKGPLITISFNTAEGVEIGKTKIKIKNVDVGVVEDIELSEKLDRVIVTARIHKQDSKFLTTGSDFWVVKPRVGKGGISGLSTILSGAYIEFAPGLTDEKADSFEGLDSAPVTPSGTKGLHVTLESGAFRSLDVGDQVLFHGVEVGRIEYVYFNTEERRVYYDAFIESPHDELITTNTKFWELNGFEIELSANGIEVQTGTLETMISGGVTFDVPNKMPRGERVTRRKVFTVYPSKNSINDNQYRYSLQFILLFDDSIRGLKPGAPVEYRGIKIGNVTRTDIDYKQISNILDKNTFIPVMISLEPGRMGFDDSEQILPKVKEEIKNLIKKGLRGALGTGNLLTGSKYIELQYEQGVTHDIEEFDTLTVIPTLEGQFSQILKKVSNIMDKLYKLPLEPMIISADDTLKQLSKTLTDFSTASKQLEILLKQSTDTELVNTLQETLDNFSRLARDFSSGSKTNEELQSTLRFMRKNLQELEPLLRQLNQKPNSLIFSNQKNEDIVPEGQNQ